MKPSTALLGLGAILLVLASLAGVDSCRKHQGAQAEHQAAIHQGEANAHAGQAQAIPDHAAAIQRAEAKAQAAEAGVARAWAEVARLRKQVAAQTGGVQNLVSPDPTVPGPSPADHRDELLAADAVLITNLGGQVAALKGENGELRLALDDEKRRSEQWRQAFEAERKATAAQQAATEAWKKAVTTSRWRGRIEGFAAGVALGYVGGKR